MTISKIKPIPHQEVIDSLNYCRYTGVFTWNINCGRAKKGDVAGSLQSHGHILIQIKRQRFLAHRLAWLFITGSWPKNDLDHIDGNPSNNILNNLRDVTRSVNIQNQHRPHKKNQTGFLGVYTAPKNRYRSAIRLSGKTIYIGMFDTPEAAHDAYLNKKRQIHTGCSI